MTTATLTDAQWRALVAMTRSARCVGSTSTDVQVGYVNTIAAQGLVTAGLARQEEGATGKQVFVLTDDGWTVARAREEA